MDYNELELLLYRLFRYGKRMSYKIKRGRGNPKELTDALAKYIRGDRCFVCHKGNAKLHHVSGDWRNYLPENLVFVCDVCHLQLHEGCWSKKPIKISSEVVMRNINDIQPIETVSKTRIVNGKSITGNFVPEGTWLMKGNKITDRGMELYYFVKQLVGSGKTITDACRILAEKYRVTDTSLKTAYGVIDKRMNDINTTAGKSVSTKMSYSGNRTMTFDEVQQLFRFCQDNGITII